MAKRLGRLTLSLVCALAIVCALALTMSGQAAAAGLQRGRGAQSQHAQVALDFDSGQCTQASPALLYGGSIWYIAWIGCDSSAKLNIETFSYIGGALGQGTKYTFGATLGEGVGPALTYFAGLPFVTWVTTSGQITTAFFSAGQLIDQTAVPGAGTAKIPAVAVNAGTVYVAWTGKDPSGHLNFKSSSNGTSWGSIVTVTDTSVNGPALDSFGGSLYVGWAGTDVPSHINTGYFYGATTLAGKHTTTAATEANVGMATFNSHLQLGFSTTTNDTPCTGFNGQCIYLTTSTDGLTWSETQQCDFAYPCSDFGPAVAADSSRVLMAWEMPCHNCFGHGDWQIHQV